MPLTEEKRTWIEVYNAIQRIERTGLIMQLGIAVAFVACLVLILIRGSDIAVFQNYVSSIDTSHLGQALLKMLGPLFGVSLLIGLISIFLRSYTFEGKAGIIALAVVTALYIIMMMKVDPDANFQANISAFKISAVLVSITMGIICLLIFFGKAKILIPLLIIITVINGVIGMDGIAYITIFSIIAVAPGAIMLGIAEGF